MYMECTNNNPVVRAFIALLQERTVPRSTARIYLNHSTDSDDKVDIFVTSTGPNGLHHRHSNAGECMEGGSL